MLELMQHRNYKKGVTLKRSCKEVTLYNLSNFKDIINYGAVIGYISLGRANTMYVLKAGSSTG